jgi:peptidoglycan/xylan/chitin deacetylase (PgdA/CDA1 family)
MRIKNFVYGVMFMIIAAGCASRDAQVAHPLLEKKYIAVSFDDGPGEKTGRLLDVLREHNVKATFFLIGQNIRSRPQEARQIFAQGHEIGSHSDGYAGLGVNGKADENAIRQSLSAASAAIKEITGTNPACFRAPNLDYSDTLTAVVQEMGMALIGSDVIGRDWEEHITTEQIIDNILDSAKDGGIILLHERHNGDLERTIRAVPVIVRELRAQGYELVSVSELAAQKGAVLEAGKRYDAVRP